MHIKATNRKVIWVTLLYATNFFKSDCMKVTLLLSVARMTQTEEYQENVFLKEIIVETRNAPYLPNFNNSPASTIDPEVLASTWAFGSQK